MCGRSSAIWAQDGTLCPNVLAVGHGTIAHDKTFIGSFSQRRMLRQIIAGIRSARSSAPARRPTQGSSAACRGRSQSREGSIASESVRPGGCGRVGRHVGPRSLRAS